MLTDLPVHICRRKLYLFSIDCTLLASCPIPPETQSEDRYFKWGQTTLLQGREHLSAVAFTCLHHLPTIPLSPTLQLALLSTQEPVLTEDGRHRASVSLSVGEGNWLQCLLTAIPTGEDGRPMAYSHTLTSSEGILRGLTQGFPFSREHLTDSAV